MHPHSSAAKPLDIDELEDLRCEAVRVVIASLLSEELEPVVGQMRSTLREAVDAASGPSENPVLRRHLSTLEEHLQEVGELPRRLVPSSQRPLTHSDRAPLRQTLEDSLNTLERTLGDSVQLATRISPDLPELLVDAGSIQLALRELVKNSARALGPEGGLVEVRADDVSVDEDHPTVTALQGVPAGRYVRVSVSDTGRGMEPSILQRAFEPFFTAGEASRGMGLGLPIVRHIMAAHGGIMNLESRPDRGSTVRLYFPLLTRAEPTPGQAPPSTRDSIPASRPSGGFIRGNGQHVMCVDDDEVINFITIRALQHLGYQATGFCDPCAALEAFRADPESFDAVLTDLTMPGLSGPELALELRQIRAGIPLLLTSGAIRPEDIETARSLGLTDLISKPCGVEDMGRILHRLFHGSDQDGRPHLP